jgi:uncharacterized protein YndB with AHSA1/START domain
MLAPAVFTQGWPVVIESTLVLPAPPAAVWEHITDWENQDRWMLEASDFVVTSEKREGIGVEAEATISIAGIKTRDKVRVIGWDPGRRLAIEHLGWVSGVGEIYLTLVADDRAHVYWREELEPPLGMAGALGMSAVKPLMRRIFRKDLNVLAEVVGQRASASGR